MQFFNQIMHFLTLALTIAPALSIPISPIPTTIHPKLSGDSVTVFNDPSLRYPTLHDALYSLCRRLADLHREYELDRTFRIKELNKKVVGDLEGVCAESLRLPRPLPFPPPGKQTVIHVR